MFTCTICKFTQVPLDDVAVPAARAGSASCICLRCYLRETDTGIKTPKALRQDVDRD